MGLYRGSNFCNTNFAEGRTDAKFQSSVPRKITIGIIYGLL